MNSSCEAKSDASKVPERAVTPARTLMSSATRRASSALRAARYNRAPSDAKRSASARAIGLVAPRIRILVIVRKALRRLSGGIHPKPARQARREAVVGIGNGLCRLPLGEIRIHRAKRLGSKARILGQVHAPAALQHHRVDRVEKFQQSFRHREVECERVAWHREGKQAVLRAELFEYGEKRSAPAAADGFEHFDQARAALAGRPHALILHEAAFAIDSIPVPDRIERVEKTFPVEDAVRRGLAMKGIIERVERLDGKPIQRKSGQVEWNQRAEPRYRAQRIL